MNAKRRIASAVICLPVFLTSLISSADAQTKVALIDIGAVFKNHPQFSAQLAELKNRADQFKAESQQLQQQLMQQAEGLNLFEKESEEYRDKEAELAKESATLEVDQRAKMRELLKQEAQLHFDTYVEISNVISTYCDEYGIQLVLRFDRKEMSAKDPNSIMQKVNGGVVYRSETADITDAIIQRISVGAREANQTNNLNR